MWKRVIYLEVLESEIQFPFIREIRRNVKLLCEFLKLPVFCKNETPACYLLVSHSLQQFSQIDMSNKIKLFVIIEVKLD